VGLAEPYGFVRTFVDLGPEMREALRDLATRDRSPLYVERLLGAFPIPAGGGSGAAGVPAPLQPALRALPEPLTERELEVLDGLGRRLSNKEIAEELAISPLTVKRHASNIYGKLGVASRRQAIRRADEAGLLSID
jgi:LuxR family maltose regulon positive regulatory protein